MKLLNRASDEDFDDLAETTIEAGHPAPLAFITLRFLVNTNYGSREKIANEITESLEWLTPGDHHAIYEIVWEDND